MVLGAPGSVEVCFCLLVDSPTLLSSDEWICLGRLLVQRLLGIFLENPLISR